MTEKQKAAIVIRSTYEKGQRVYGCDDRVMNSFEKEYRAIPSETRLSRLASGSVMTISDCFIVYVIACWGCISLRALFNVLKSLKNRHKDLFITDFADYEKLRERLRSLRSNGFIFTIRYDIRRGVATSTPTTDEEYDEDDHLRVALYTVDRMAVSIMDQALRKKVHVRDWLQAAREYMLIGCASATYAASCLTSYEGFYDIDEGRVRTGFVNGEISAEVVFKNAATKKVARIGTMSIFLRDDERIMTGMGYYQSVVDTYNLIKNYLYSRQSGGREAYLILVVEDNADLNRFTEHATQFVSMMEGYLPSIFFTSEGAIRTFGEDFSKCLIRCVEDSSAEFGYSFEHATIPLLQGKRAQS